MGVAQFEIEELAVEHFVEVLEELVHVEEFAFVVVVEHSGLEPEPAIPVVFEGLEAERVLKIKQNNYIKIET